MQAIKKAVVKTGEYQKDGQTKGRYHTIGTLFDRPDGSQVLKMDCLPLIAGEMWVNFYDLDERGPTPQEAKAAALDDVIPF